jgi:hypothetical protein
MEGFNASIIEKTYVSFDFESPNEFTTFSSETVGPLQKMLASQSNERRIEILKAITKAAEKYADNNTREVSFENEAILIVGIAEAPIAFKISCSFWENIMCIIRYTFELWQEL